MVSPVSSSSSNSNASVAAQLSQTPAISEVNFLQLLTTQMQNQDPLNPESETDMASQLAQFSALQQQTETNTNLTTLNNTTQENQAAMLLGQTVQATDNNGNAIQGQVTGINLNDGSPILTINSEQIPLSQVQIIQ